MDGSQPRAVMLARLEEQLAEAQALTHIGSWDWTPGDDRVEWSDELYRIFGAPPGSPRHLDSYLDALHEEDRDMTQAAIARALADGQPFDHVERIVRPSGEVRVLRSRGRAQLDAEGKVTKLVGTCQDVTDEEHLRRQMERLQRMDAVGRLAGGVAHDLNNLLTVILSYSQLVELSADRPEDVRSGMNEVRRAADSAAELSRQLLMFARGDVTPLSVVDVVKVVRSSAPILERAMRSDVELVLDCPPDVGRVRSSSSQIEQVLMNLVLNARDAIAGDGAVQVAVRNETLTEARSPELPAAEYVVIEVRDDGAGMEPDVAARAVEPFFTTKARGQGTGLGLSTVYGIASRAGGHVEIDSAPGEGTTVRAWFPRSREVPSDLADVTRSLPGALGARVLVVEGTASLRGLMGRVLDQAGFKARLAADYGSAMQLLREPGKTPDVLVVDGVIQGGTGAELARELRERRADAKVILMNGYSSHDAEHPPDARVLAKPFTPDDLIAAVESALASE